MHLLTHWRSERSVYEEECKARVGFAINFTDPVTHPHPHPNLK